MSAESIRKHHEARAAKTIPWDANRTALYRTIFPQMAGCLPSDEGAQLRFDFDTEMARLEAAQPRVRAQALR
jgi:hypothetical protein